jgi:hypothetical protein
LYGLEIATHYFEQSTHGGIMSDDIKQDAESTALSNDDLGGVTGGAAAPKAAAAAAGATPAGKGGTNPLHSAVAGPITEPLTELQEADLENVAGGKGQVQIQDIHVTKGVDKSSVDL